AIAAIAQSRGGAMIVDEIYHGLVYEGACITALEFSADLFVINSFSKYFNMTGWRLGWMVVPEAYVREFDKLSQNIYLSAPIPAPMPPNAMCASPIPTRSRCWPKASGVSANFWRGRARRARALARSARRRLPPTARRRTGARARATD